MFGKNPFSDEPSDDETPSKPPSHLACPVCGSSDFEGHQNQYETFRDCRKCGNRWSSGSLGAAQPDFLFERPPPPGIPAPDDDLDVVQYTGAAFRDPSKNFDGDW